MVIGLNGHRCQEDIPIGFHVKQFLPGIPHLGENDGGIYG